MLKIIKVNKNPKGVRKYLKKGISEKCMKVTKNHLKLIEVPYANSRWWKYQSKGRR